MTDAVLYDAFGMTVSRTGTTATPFGFVGAQQYQSDADSGLQLLGHRMYDPSVGRFISSDPAKAGTNWYAYCLNQPLRGIDPLGLDVSFGDIMGQLGNGDTWRDGLGTAGYALGNLVTLGGAYGDQSGRPGFRESQIGWGIGGGALIGAGGLAAAPIIATNPIYIGWAAGGGSAAVGAGGSEKFMRLCSAAEAQAVDEAGGLVESNGSGIFGPPIASATRIFPAEKLPVMKVNPPFDDLGKYGHLIEIELRQGWNIPANGAIVGRDGFGSTVSVPQINQFIQSIKVGPRS